MDHSLFLERKLDDFVVVAFDRDHGLSAGDRDQLGAGRKAQRISDGRQTRGDLFVGARRGEARLLPHRILEAIEAEIGFPERDSEVRSRGKNEKYDQTSESARAPAVYHCDCAPSITSLTIRSIACRRPSATPRSSYCPSASNPFRCQRVLPVT